MSPSSRLLSIALLRHARRFSYLSPTPLSRRIPQSLHFRHQFSRLCSTQTALDKQSPTQLVLSPPALVVTREYEWANIIVGFEQANRYTIRAAPAGTIVGYLAEESSFGSVITRNVMRRRRPFRATVMDKDGNVVFRMRRPIYLISTSIFIETDDGNPIGEVHMDWHLWRRRYSLYIDKTQFAVVDSGLLAVDFDMRDVHGRKLAAVNKDFTGFAREIFTDARQYVLRLDPRFGLSADGVLVTDAATVADEPASDFSDQRLSDSERAVILATAIAIDFDYFSLHSRSGMHPGLMMMPGGGGGAPPPPMPPGGGGAGTAGAAVGADVLSDAAGGTVDETGGMDNTVGSSETPGGIDDNPYGDQGSSSGMENNAGAGEQEWATFDEPDHGFNDSFQDDNAWTPDSEETFGSGFGSDVGGGEEGGASGGLFEIIRSIFFDNE